MNTHEFADVEKIVEELRKSPPIEKFFRRAAHLTDEELTQCRESHLQIEELVASTYGGKAEASLASAEKKIAEAASDIHKLTWKYARNDAEAWVIWCRAHANMYKAGAIDENTFTMVATDGFFRSDLWLGKWANCGYQTVEVEEKYAASLCATTIAKSELKHIILPWPTFCVRLPTFLRIPVAEDRKLFVSVTQWDKSAGGHLSVTLHGTNKFVELPVTSVEHLQLGDKDAEGLEYHKLSYSEGVLNTSTKRLMSTVGRFVLGVCLSMSDKKIVRKYGPTLKKRSPAVGPRRGTPNASTLYVLSKPVVVDARAECVDYIFGQGRRINVRTLVAGHWKRQPYGPRSSLRRWQQIECYWKGPEDAPIVRRPHEVRGQS